MHLAAHLTMLWFIPLALLEGIYGTWTARSVRNMADPRMGRASSGLLVLAWTPALIWITQQFHS